MDEPQRRYAKWREPDSEGCILFHSISMTFGKRKTAGAEHRSVGCLGAGGQGRSWLQRGSLPLYFWGGIGTILHLDGGVVILYAFIRKAERPIKRLLHCLVRKWLWLWLVDWRQVDRFQDLSGGRSTVLGVWQKHGVGKRSWSFIMSHFLICVPRSAVEPFAGSSNICWWGAIMMLGRRWLSCPLKDQILLYVNKNKYIKTSFWLLFRSVRPEGGWSIGKLLKLLRAILVEAWTMPHVTPEHISHYCPPGKRIIHPLSWMSKILSGHSQPQWNKYIFSLVLPNFSVPRWAILWVFSTSNTDKESHVTVGLPCPLPVWLIAQLGKDCRALQFALTHSKQYPWGSLGWARFTWPRQAPQEESWQELA